MGHSPQSILINPTASCSGLCLWSRIWHHHHHEGHFLGTDFLENANDRKQLHFKGYPTHPPVWLVKMVKTLSCTLSVKLIFKNMALAVFFSIGALRKTRIWNKHSQKWELDTGLFPTQPGRQCHEKKQKKRQSKKRRQFVPSVFYCSVHLWYDLFFLGTFRCVGYLLMFFVLLKDVDWYLQVVCQAESGSLTMEFMRFQGDNCKRMSFYFDSHL